MIPIIPGLTPSYKVPGVFGHTIFGASAINAGTIPLVLWLVGLKTASGSLTPDVDVTPCNSIDEADALAGAGSELGNMAYAAFTELRAKGYTCSIVLSAVSPAGGAVSASATVVFATNATSVGTPTFSIGGWDAQITIGAGTTPTQAGDRLVAAFAALPRCPVTGVNVAGTVTFTANNATVRGNELILYKAGPFPGGMTVTLGGGGAAVGSNGIRFTGGTGVETMTALLGSTSGMRFNRIAAAQGDAVSAAAWEAENDAKAQPLEGKTQHVIMAHTGTQAAAITIAQTTLNNPRFEYVHHENQERPSSWIAAAMAAVRTGKEGQAPGPGSGANSGYDDVVLTTLRPQRNPGERPNTAAQQLALDNGVTPLKTEGVEVRVVRAVTTKSRSGTNPDYRTLDTAQATVPDYVRDVLVLVGKAFCEANPNVRPDPADGEPPAPTGVATPQLWKSVVKGEMSKLEAQAQVTQVTQNPPLAEYDNAAGRIMSAVPARSLPLQHQLGVVVMQENVAA